MHSHLDMLLWACVAQYIRAGTSCFSHSCQGSGDDSVGFPNLPSNSYLCPLSSPTSPRLQHPQLILDSDKPWVHSQLLMKSLTPASYLLQSLSFLDFFFFLQCDVSESVLTLYVHLCVYINTLCRICIALCRILFAII